MPNLKPLVDGDILLYEIGFGAETGWREITNDPEAVPPFSYVESMLQNRLDNIQAMVGTEVKPLIFITQEAPTFRFSIARTKPYKGTRKANKPWHYRNLRAYILGCCNSVEVRDVEADDMMAMVHSEDPNTIICSRDKDLKQIPGWSYSWELGRQPQFGPTEIDKHGTLHLSEDNKKLTGTGLLFFYAQMLIGDTVDNIPGLPKCGPVAAYRILTEESNVPLLERVSQAYCEHYGHLSTEEEPLVWQEKMIEQGQLCWIVRRLREDGTPEMWFPGLED